MSPIAVLYLVYAAVLIAGGAFGYAKSRSVPSLASGAASGVVMVFAAVIVHHHPRVGLGLGALVGLALAAVFARRYAATRRPMPALPILALSVLVLAYSLLRLTPALARHA